MRGSYGVVVAVGILVLTGAVAAAESVTVTADVHDGLECHCPSRYDHAEDDSHGQ